MAAATPVFIGEVRDAASQGCFRGMNTSLFLGTARRLEVQVRAAHGEPGQFPDSPLRGLAAWLSNTQDIVAQENQPSMETQPVTWELDRKAVFEPAMLTLARCLSSSTVSWRVL